ncbi:MAG TPA: histidine kinase dimerization/phospho-acceptor domain-containing protein [Stellaceae bacterium]|nr:histidine kinase dimerization/phospho-acceptor domain-containing protein [Stellaceae bacterium]
MSHELRTPLNAIIGFSEVISSALTTRSVRRKSRSIPLAAARSLTMRRQVSNSAAMRTGVSRNSSRPASTFDRSSRSLMMRSR